MKTAISLSGGYGSAYNLWKVAQNTTDEITAIFVDFDYYTDEGGFSSKGTLSNAQNVVNWVSSNVRNVAFVVLNINNYDPKYSGIPSLEIVDYAKVNGFDKIIFNDDSKDNLSTHSYLRNGVDKIKENLIVSYPIRKDNKINYQIAKELPSQLFSCCSTNLFFAPSELMQVSGSTISQIAEKQKNIISNTQKNESSEWVATDDTFGTINFGLSVRGTHRHLINLWL